jgi:hypothetical protein
MTVTPELAAEILDTAEANAALSRSKVKPAYKRAYAERALTARGKKGVDKRVVADSNGDWLALELAALLRPTKKSRCDLDLFRRILDLNGVDYSRLPVGTPNWQGRFRMNGGQMLRTKVAEQAALVLPDATLTPPHSWVAKHGG